MTLKEALKEAIERGEAKIEVKITCSLCRKEFHTDGGYEAHLVQGVFHKICPGPYKNKVGGA